VEHLKAELARRKFRDFVAYTKPDYDFNWHHEALCQKLEDFAQGKIKKLMVFMPPQHGKTELTTRRFPPYLLGKNPDRRIAVVSYAATIAEGFNRDMQRIIDDEKYNMVFPETYLNESNVVSSAKGSYLRNSEIFEVVGHKGYVKTVGTDGSLTSKTVDVGIIDDPYKGRDEALSRSINEGVWSFYVNVFLMRLHNESQQLLIMTRWHENDLAGRILKSAKPGEWTIVMFQGIKEREIPGDPRKKGEALWPRMHSEERLLETKALSRVTFDASYQQEPKAPKEVLVYPNWRKIKSMPDHLPKFYAGDFGYANDPTAIVEMAIKLPRVYVREILYKTRLTNQGIIDALKALGISIKKRYIWDSEDPKSITDLQTKGMAALAAVKGPGSVNLGINELRELEICVTSDSHNLINELNSYQFQVYGGTITNEPIDKDNHLLDAMRYGYTNRHLNGKIKI
jgi:hypothetical protein